MSDSQLYQQIDALPSALKEEVKDFVEFLTNKISQKNINKQRIFGYSKDFFLLKDDFDEPLEDFKEYME